MQVNNLVKKTAADLNIDLCRITDGSELKKEREILIKRAKSKYWPQQFTNRDIDQLTKPKLHFPNLKSIITAAVNYNNSGSRFLSNYVTVKDYHNYLEDKLEKLVLNIKRKLNKDFNYKIYVDSAPFLEKAIARKAGLGFIGNNTLLINPELGSYLFLGEIFTDLEIEIDKPLTVDCGDCRICLDNCEGNALKAEYLLDADDCISYLTQKKGILPQAEIKKIGGHIWGCDACQYKCPYNKNAAKPEAAELAFFDKGLEYFLNLDRKDCPTELENTAIVWRGNRVLIRNALIAAANLKQEKYFDLIRKKLCDNSPIIRYFAAYSLAEIDFKNSKSLIKKQIKKEKNQEYRNKMQLILEKEE